MKKRILTVDDTFLIQGRGLVITAQKTQDFANLKIGDSIEIENPDKTFVNTKIRGIDFVGRRIIDEDSKKSDDRLISFLIENEVEKSQVLKGAIIWLLNDGN